VEKRKVIFVIIIFAIVITFNLVYAIFPSQISTQQEDVSFQEFYNELSPYGHWVEDHNYGYIWIPIAGPSFTPYLTNGFWVMTNYGWTWVSEYDWGWATFHYGRWDYNGSYGWFWVPEIEWGPAWVTWRKSDGYYGWAPMRPGVSISVTFTSYNDVPNDRWTFVKDKDIDSRDLINVYINRENNFKLINNSIVINTTYYDEKRQTTYVAGPDRQEVQKIIGRTIKTVVIHEIDKPGQILDNDRLQIYRPQLHKNKSGNKRAPSELTNLKDVKQISERDNYKQYDKMLIQKNGKGNAQQSVASSKNKLGNKNNEAQLPKLFSHKEKNNNVQTSQISNSNPPKDKDSAIDRTQNRNSFEIPVKGALTDRSSPEEKLDTQMIIKSEDQLIKPKTMLQPKTNSANQPSKPRPDYDKK
jgi:hypothetical protein